MRVYIRVCFLILASLPGCRHEESTTGSDVETLNTRDSTGSALLADLYYRGGDCQNALREYDVLIARSEATGQHYYRTAWCLAELKRLKEAIEYYQVAAQKGYRPADAFYSIGFFYTLEMGGVKNDSLAILYLEKSFEIDPSSEPTRKLLSYLKGSKGP